MSKPCTAKLLTLGDSGCGKSSLLIRYTQDEFDMQYPSTIGIDFRLKRLEIGGKQVKVAIYDSAGQDRFRSITRNYFRGSHGIVVVFDITRRDSFDNIRKWMEDIKTYAEENVNLILIGNKLDLEEKRAVTIDEAKALAKEYGIPYFETSARNNINVDKAFDSLAEKVIKKVYPNFDKEKEKDDGTINLDDSKTTKSKCC